MVNSATSLSSSGLRDWIIQRVTAVILAIFVIYLTFFMLTHPHLNYLTWHSLFAQTWMRVFTLLAIVSLVLHAWIGLWIVSTDYIKLYTLRFLIQILIIVGLFGLLFWCVEILWGL
jgi:succinate dehydrogenase / fumarate reductase, membrane anchor subunit